MTEASTRRTEFTNEQYDEVYPEGIDRHFWYVARNAIVLDAIRWIERQYRTRIGCMLEVGCGPGVVVDYLRRNGRDCYGVELAPVAVPENLKERIWGGTDCLSLPEKFRAGVELVLLLDVIEHIEDPAGFLAKIRDVYRNCRWVLISVPARKELWSNFDDRYGHFRRYDVAMLGRELEAAGAAMVRSRYRFALLYPILYALARIGKGRPLSNRTPRPAFLHRLLGEVIRRETWVCPRWVYGTSIVAIGRFEDRGK